MKIAILSVFFVCYGGLASAQQTLLDQALGVINQNTCNTFLASIAFNDLCQGGIANATQSCNLHCQCVHGNVWGACVEPSEGSAAKAAGFTQMCACYTPDGPPMPTGVKKWPTQPKLLLEAQCLLQMTAFSTLFYQSGPLPAQNGTALCILDCTCAHGLVTGVANPAQGQPPCICLDEHGGSAASWPSYPLPLPYYDLPV